LALIETVGKKFPSRLDEYVKLGAELKEEVYGLLGNDSVILYPSYASTAPKHGIPLLIPIKWVYTAIWNVLELPVTQVPMGVGPSGLPTGVQVVAPHGHDHISIAVALELEKAFGGWATRS